MPRRADTRRSKPEYRCCFQPGHDWFYTYYREKGVAISLGMDLKDIFLGMLSRDGDPNSGGVNMAGAVVIPGLEARFTDRLYRHAVSTRRGNGQSLQGERHRPSRVRFLR